MHYPIVRTNPWMRMKDMGEIYHSIYFFLLFLASAIESFLSN